MIFRPSAPRCLMSRIQARISAGRAGAPLADDRIDQDARRDDRVRVALGLPALRLVEVAADFARRGHAGGEVEVALVLNRLRHARLALFVPVHVRVDDARHHVLAGAVDHRVGRPRVRRGRPVDADVRDQAVLDDDVDRTVRRPGAAVDHHGVADDRRRRRLGVERAASRGACCAASAEGRAASRSRAPTSTENAACDRADRRSSACSSSSEEADHNI